MNVMKRSASLIWRLALLPLAALLLVGGCSPTVEPAPSEWREDVIRAAQGATSPLEREILSDGAITEAEFREAFAAFQECMDGLGVAIEMTESHGQFAGFSTGSGDADQAAETCRPGTIDIIEPWFVQIRGNPARDSQPEVTVRCLKRMGVVGEGYSVADLERDQTSADTAYGPGLQLYLDCLTLGDALPKGE